MESAAHLYLDEVDDRGDDSGEGTDRENSRVPRAPAAAGELVGDVPRRTTGVRGISVNADRNG